jgi:putative glycosyltransferase (TIGR04372 family)
MALCIPNVRYENVKYFDKNKLSLDKLHIDFLENKFLHDIYMPDVYFTGLPFVYPSIWKTINNSNFKLEFPSNLYENKFNIPSGSIVFHVREKGTYDKRVEGSKEDLQRFVKPETILELMYIYADMGFNVVQIGDNKQKRASKHKNILDLCGEDTNVLDDLYAISNSIVFLSCDSGIWPMAGGLRKNLILSNVTSVYSRKKMFRKHNVEMINPEIISWLPHKTSKVLFKELVKGEFFDNSINQLKLAIDSFITT